MPRFLAAAALALIVGASPAAQPAPAVLSRLLWFDRAGGRLGNVGPVADHGNLELSPDGRQVAVAVRTPSGATRDIWMYDTSSGERTQFTFGASDENWLIWAPDGRRVLLNSFNASRLVLLEGPSSGEPPRTPLLEGADGVWPVSWSPDGQHVLYVTNSQATGNDIWVLPLNGTTPRPFLRTAASENWAAFSPDGRFVAFSSTESGQPEVYVSPFPEGGPRWRVSADGGTQARWRRDGAELFYVAPDGMLMAARLAVRGRELAVAGFEALFTLSHPYGAYHAFDVGVSGDRFLVNTLVGDRTAPRSAALQDGFLLNPVS